MSRRHGAVHVVTTKRHYKGRTYTAHLLRRSYREDGKVKNETVGNLSHLPDHVVDLVRRALKGEALAAVQDLFEVVRSPAHGTVQAVLTAIRRLRFEPLIGTRPSRERRLVVAMVAARILNPLSKLATTRWWHGTTLPEQLQVADATEDDLYAAMDWLLERQPRIEKTLADRHLREQGVVLYDLTSSYFEGVTCPLAARGKNRDGKQGKLQVNYGLLTDRCGRPISVSVHPGNTGDPTTFLPQVNMLRDAFGLQSVVVVGDRGMITQTQIDVLKTLDDLDWITALKPEGLRRLLEGGYLQMGLFDERNLFELTHPDFPGERLVACRNPALAERRAATRTSLLEATVREIETVRRMVRRGRLRNKSAAAIGVRVGKVINTYKVAKHFHLDITQGRFEYHVLAEQVAAEAALDGIYVIRTSLPHARLNADDTVRSYKLLSHVERAFLTLKSLGLQVRPIRHRTERRVRAHIFLCMLAYYIQWHLHEAWRELLFSDEDQEATQTRDPVAPATRSDAALRKVHERTLVDGTPTHSFRTLLDELGGIVRNVCRRHNAPDDEPTFTMTTTPNPTQQRALDLLASINL